MHAPPGYRIYSEIVNRLGDVRETGDGLTFQCLFPERHAHGDRSPSGRCWVGAKGDLLAKCMGCGATWDEIVEAVGLPKTEWFVDKGNKFKKGSQPVKPEPTPKKVADYVYRSSTGEILATKSKWKPGFHGRVKDFVWSRPVPEEIRDLMHLGDEAVAVVDGPKCMEAGSFVATAWADGTWHLRSCDPNEQRAILLPAAELELFNADLLAATKPTEPVFVVEGEKDATTLTRIGFVAVCSPFGSTKWLDQYSEALRGRPVIICPDNDEPGRSYAKSVAGSLLWHGVRQLRILKPSADYAPRPGGDVTDWLIAKGFKGKRDAARAEILRIVGSLERLECRAKQLQ